jgi:hypothetical protein
VSHIQDKSFLFKNKKGESMNIYQIELNGEKEYVCANTAIEAIQTLLKTHDMLFEDLEHTYDIRQIPQENWGNFHIYEDDTPLMSFEEFMSEPKRPEVFCSTANM